MRKGSSVLLFLILAASAFAGGKKKEPAEPPTLAPFQQDEQGVVYYEVIHEVSAASSADLFTKAEGWIIDSFKKDQVENRVADSNRGWLKFVTRVVTPKGWHGLDTSGDGFLRFQIQLAFKDGRVRFRATDYHFLVAPTWSGDGKMRVAVTDEELFLKNSKKLAKARVELAAQLAVLSDSLGVALAAPTMNW